MQGWAPVAALQPTACPSHTKELSSGAGEGHMACSHYTWRESMQEMVAVLGMWPVQMPVICLHLGIVFVSS